MDSITEPAPMPQNVSTDDTEVTSLTESIASLKADSEDGDDDRADMFAAVLEAVNLVQLPKYCAVLRNEIHPDDASSLHSLPTLHKPIFGSYHALLPISFHDGLKWLMKIPANGTKNSWDESASRAITAEASTMMFLRRNTSVPLPDVLAFDASLNNDLGCPFIMISFIEGLSLYDFWFDKSRADNQESRTTVLEDIAAAMAQLDRFLFDTSGSLLFDRNGQPTGVGSVRCLDHQAMLEAMFGERADESVKYFDVGPFPDARSYYTQFLDRQLEPEDHLQKGLRRLLHSFLNWIPGSEDSRKKFVLAHPDFDIQNFIVSTDGHLKAIIDWDGVAAVPCGLGYESYPGWLTRDWGPAMYGWTQEMEDGVEPEGLREDSPATLAKHRAEYAGFMQIALSKERSSNSLLTSVGQGGMPSMSWTANSLYVENLFIASHNPVCTFEILRMFIDKMNEDLRKQEHAELDIFDLADALADGKLGRETEIVLKTAFQALFQ